MIYSRSSQYAIRAMTHLTAHANGSLCRLETIRGQLAPEQQTVVDETARMAKEMATFTQDAIVFLNGHHDNLWNPSYRTYLNDLYKEAKSVNQTVSRSRES